MAYEVSVINNISSQKCSLQCGIPQGSILGPLLFLIYINDLPDCNLMSDCRLFADDTSLTYADKHYNQVFSAMNNDLNILKSRLDGNKLSLNALKTRCMFISTRHKLATIPEQPEISANGHNIKRVKIYKSLGIELDELLSWDEHIIITRGHSETAYLRPH